MKVVLELLDQNSNIKKVTVRHDIVIGRGADCNLRLSAPQVSRRHCFLRIGAEGAFVSDLDSSNGTFLDGKKLSSGTRVELKNGTTLSVGPVKFVAHVRSEVLAGDVLHVDIADNRIVAESGSTFEAPSDDYLATIAHSAGPQGLMDFAVEHVGPSASEDDPTADYLATNPGSPTFFHQADNDELPNLEAAASDEIMILADLTDDDAPTVPASDCVSDAIIESVEIISIKEDEQLVIDDDDMIIDVVAEPNAQPNAQTNGDSKPAATEDDDETELRDFLSGLD